MSSEKREQVGEWTYAVRDVHGELSEAAQALYEEERISWRQLERLEMVYVDGLHKDDAGVATLALQWYVDNDNDTSGKAKMARDRLVELSIELM